MYIQLEDPSDIQILTFQKRILNICNKRKGFKSSQVLVTVRWTKLQIKIKLIIHAHAQGHIKCKAIK